MLKQVLCEKKIIIILFTSENNCLILLWFLYTLKTDFYFSSFCFIIYLLASSAIDINNTEYPFPWSELEPCTSWFISKSLLPLSQQVRRHKSYMYSEQVTLFYQTILTEILKAICQCVSIHSQRFRLWLLHIHVDNMHAAYQSAGWPLTYVLTSYLLLCFESRSILTAALLIPHNNIVPGICLNLHMSAIHLAWRPYKTEEKFLQRRQNFISPLGFTRSCWTLWARFTKNKIRNLLSLLKNILVKLRFKMLLLNFSPMGE